MPFKGLLLHIADIEALATAYPETKVIIDHFGFCKCDNLESPEWQALLGLARFPQVQLSCSIGWTGRDWDCEWAAYNNCVKGCFCTRNVLPDVNSHIACHNSHSVTRVSSQSAAWCCGLSMLAVVVAAVPGVCQGQCLVQGVWSAIPIC
jgi:hypothetical protein